MNAKQFAEKMKADIEEEKSKGTTVLKCETVIAYLDIFLNSTQVEPSAKEIERYVAILDRRTARYQYELDQH